jgi:hypothetical protein
MAAKLTLSPDGRMFAIEGEPTFLLGASYYGGLEASEEFLQRDLAELRERGFNWIRVWATWAAFGNNVSAVSADGRPREPYLSRLQDLCARAAAVGMAVDVTFSRGDGVVGESLDSTCEAHMRAVTTVTEALGDHRNVYFDLGNERNIDDPRHVEWAELRGLRERVKELDPERLVTASHAGDIPPPLVRQYLEVAGVDFLAPHRPRRPGTAGETHARTREYLELTAQLRRPVPVHYQEPFRRGWEWEGDLDDYLTDLRGAVEGGAAGWCFHNGHDRSAEDGRPRRSFDLREAEGRLFEQLDEVERAVVERAAEVAFAGG